MNATESLCDTSVRPIADEDANRSHAHESGHLIGVPLVVPAVLLVQPRYLGERKREPPAEKEDTDDRRHVSIGGDLTDRHFEAIESAVISATSTSRARRA